jgi:tetratricopeptide (TPR) repeat protein
MNLRRIVFTLLALMGTGIFISACQPTRNFTTYFNLFYNMERIMDEVEEELLYIREQKTPEPVYYVPYDDLDRRGTKFYNHLERRSMNNDEMRANKIKLDSILIKGSKLMARNTKSDYLPDAVFYIGKTYFYLREWYQSQKKAEELIAGFPESKWYPDAHLLLSMDLMQQGQVGQARTMISRTIDVGWARERGDILIDAFRLNADLELAEGNVAEALKPYERALILSTDNEDLARWQYEIGLIYFRQGDFEKALAAFDRVDEEYSPDVLTEFQTGMQRAAALRVLGRYADAEEQLEDLRDNSNYEPWYGLVELEVLNLASVRPGGEIPSDSALAKIDSASPGKAYSAYAVYERGLRAFKAGEYKLALENFTRARMAIAPFQRRAQRYGSLLERYFEQTGKAYQITQGYEPITFPDSAKAPVAEAFFNTARVFASLDIPDSMMRYYDLSHRWSAPGSKEAARVLFARSVMQRDSGRSAAADSILEILVSDYPLTDYAAEARLKLGYTEYAKIDSAEDLYRSGMSHMRVGENRQALAQLGKVITNHPSSAYAPKAYYAIGLLYEQELDDLDSAYSYYGRILDLYPASEQALAVGPLIQAVNNYRMRMPKGMPRDEENGTGVNMDWMKQNPPDFDTDPNQEKLIPLDEKAGPPQQINLNGQDVVVPRGGIKPADGGNAVQPGASKPAVTQPPGSQPAGSQPPATEPAGTGDPNAKKGPSEKKKG